MVIRIIVCIFDWISRRLYCQQLLVQINLHFGKITNTMTRKSIWFQYRAHELHLQCDICILKGKLLAAFDYDCCLKFMYQLKKINMLGCNAKRIGKSGTFLFYFLCFFLCHPSDTINQHAFHSIDAAPRLFNIQL